MSVSLGPPHTRRLISVFLPNRRKCTDRKYIDRKCVDEKKCADRKCRDRKYRDRKCLDGKCIACRGKTKNRFWNGIGDGWRP